MRLADVGGATTFPDPSTDLGQMDRQVGGWMDRWMNRRMNACVHGWVSICMHGWMDRSMHGYACDIVLDSVCVCFNMFLFCVPSFPEKFSPKSIRFIKAI